MLVVSGGLLLWGFVTYVAHKDTMLELATSSGERSRSFLMVWVNYRHCQRQGPASRSDTGHTRGGKVYHAQKAIMKPNQEKKNTRP